MIFYFHKINYLRHLYLRLYLKYKNTARKNSPDDPKIHVPIITMMERYEILKYS